MSRGKKSLVPDAKEALNKYKMEAANEVGVNLKQGYNGDLTAKQAGSVGGQMVRKMIENAENAMKNREQEHVICQKTSGFPDVFCLFSIFSITHLQCPSRKNGTPADRQCHISFLMATWKTIPYRKRIQMKKISKQ